MITGRKKETYGEKTMSDNHCRLCGRSLKNFTSIKIGIGPVCRARDNEQREFDFMKAQFDVLKHVYGEYIYIRDTGRSCRSVINDTEYVIEQLYLQEEITDETRIFYKDSNGQTDELLHSGKAFKGFSYGHQGIAPDCLFNSKDTVT